MRTFVIVKCPQVMGLSSRLKGGEVEDDQKWREAKSEVGDDWDVQS